MKKIILTILCITIFSFVFLQQKSYAMPNPWVDCGDSFECATEVSGIKFPLLLSNYWIRAMKGMIEISYPLDEFRNVEVRKTTKNFCGDISGVYTKYPGNKTIKYENNVVITQRGTFRKVYVVNITTPNAIYSAYCKQGMSKREANGVCEVIKSNEKQNF